jgi:hypothetical protein
MCSVAISFLPIYTGWFAAIEDEVDNDVVKISHQSRDDQPVCGVHDAALASVTSSAAGGPGNEAECSLKVNAVYAVVSSVTSFYLPLIVMTAVYAKIYRIARRKADEIDQLERSIAKTCISSNSNHHLSLHQQGMEGDHEGFQHERVTSNSRSRLDVQLAATSLTSVVGDVDDDDLVNDHEQSASRSLMTSSDNQFQRLPQGFDSAAAATANGRLQLKQKRKASRRDSKAIKTLGTLMGLFCVCWCPFFFFYVVQPFCPKCVVPEQLISAITWLGYGNSAVNPFVYAYLNRDFRAAYRRLIGCRGRLSPACRHGNGTAGRRSHVTDGGGRETSWSSTLTVGAPVAAASRSPGDD